jgi:hypothetical protein
MNTVASDSRQLVPVRDSVTTLRLVQHRNAADQIAPQVRVTRGERRDPWLHATPMHRPTAAECYGCVDWFQF